MKTNKMNVWYQDEYEFWRDFMNTDSSIESWTVTNNSDYTGVHYVFEWTYVKD